MKDNWVKCFATIKGTISSSEFAIKGLPGWTDALATHNPLSLWELCIEATSNEGPIQAQEDTAYLARESYKDCVMHPDHSETIVEFHERFEFAVENLQRTNAIVVFDANGDAIAGREFMLASSIARDFLGRLDSRYKKLQVDVSNNARLEIAAMPATLPLMFAHACAYGGIEEKPPRGTGTVFAAVADDARTERYRYQERHAKDNHERQSPDQVETRRCFDCLETGHLKRDCPLSKHSTSAKSSAKAVVNKPSKSSAKTSAKPAAKSAGKPTSTKHGYAAIKSYSIFSSLVLSAIGRRSIGPKTVILDSGANTSRFRNGKLLRNLRETGAMPDITAFGGQVISCSHVGDLPNFFPVGQSPDFEVNVLSLHEIETHCSVQYVQGERYIVATAAGDRHFVKGVHR